MTMQNAGNGAGGQSGNGQGGNAGGGGNNPNNQTVLTDQQAADALKQQQQNQQQTQQNPNGNGQGNQQQQQQATPDPKTAELEAALEAARDHNKTLMERLEILAIESLPPEQKERARQLIAEAKTEAEKEIKETNVTERELVLDRREIAGEYATYGLTAEALKDAKSKGEMEVIALRAKADFLEKGGKPNPAHIPSDRGGSQSGGGGTNGNANDPNRNVPQRGDKTAALIGERFNQARGQ